MKKFPILFLAGIVALFFSSVGCSISTDLQKVVASIPLDANAAYALLTITKTIPASDLPVASSINSCIATQGPAVIAELNATGTAFQNDVTAVNYLETCAAQKSLLSPEAQAIYTVVFDLIEQITGYIPAPATAPAVAQAKSMFGKTAKAKAVSVDAKKLEAGYGKKLNKITPADVLAKYKALKVAK